MKTDPIASAARSAHALAIELYRFTARWPESECEGLTLAVRRAGWELSAALNQDARWRPGRARRRALDHARGKHAALSYLLELATELGYRKLSLVGSVDRLLADVAAGLDSLTLARDDGPRWSEFVELADADQAAPSRDRPAPTRPAERSGTPRGRPG